MFAPPRSDAPLFACVHHSPLGDLVSWCSARGLVALDFDAAPIGPQAPCPVALRLDAQLAAYFAGALQRFDVPLEITSGTPFQRSVWQSLQAIAYAQRWSYAQQAQYLGRARCVRAVAAANARNPIVILIPCHRVVGSKGQLTGYRGGLDRKRYLLELEARCASGPTLEGHP